MTFLARQEIQEERSLIQKMVVILYPIEIG
jgi:hypothetical protein